MGLVWDIGELRETPLEEPFWIACFQLGLMGIFDVGLQLSDVLVHKFWCLNIDILTSLVLYSEVVAGAWMFNYVVDVGAVGDAHSR